MISKIPVLLIIALTAAAVFHCNSVQSTGGGTETVNTFARLPDGTAAAGAIARIIEARWWVDSISNGSSPVIGQAVADNRGHVKIDFQKHDARINLQIDHEKGALLLSLPAGKRDAADTVHLLKTASLSGTVDGASGKPSRVFLAGTGYEASVDASGAFSFANVAPGSYAVLCATDAASGTMLAGNGALTLGEGADRTGYGLSGPANRVLIDNFESGIGPTSLGRIFPVLGWYVLSDSLYYFWNSSEEQWVQGTSTVIGNSPIYYDSVTSAGNKAFSFSTVLDPVSYRANSVAGISLKPLSKQGIDMSSLTAFSLSASGKGILRVRFETMKLDSASSYLSNYSYPLKLTGTLQDFTIPVDSLRILEPVSDASKYPWAEESKHVLRLEFAFSTSENNRSDSLYCTLDDFYLEGVSVTSFMKSSE